MAKANIWHTLNPDQSLRELSVDAKQGLSTGEVQKRRTEYGANELEGRDGVSPWRLLAEQFENLLVILLIAAALVSGVLLHEWIDAAVIGFIVIVNALVGWRQEFRAEQAMAALKKMAAPAVRVRRDGKEQEVPSASLVPGDIVLLDAGSRVPADGRLLEAADLRTQESSLTGESVPVEKHLDAVDEPNTPVGDRLNMVYMGTLVTSGRGTAVVTSTGMHTELGRIADRLQKLPEVRTTLQVQLDRLGRLLVVAALVVISIIALMGLARDESLRTIFLTAVSMAVAAVPEGLPAVVTIALALGAQRMLARRALIRKLPAVETLGSVTVICSDKTGTLTQNRMTVTRLELAGQTIDRGDGQHPIDVETPDIALMLAGGLLCNDASLTGKRDAQDRLLTIGDPTEGALVVAAVQAGIDEPLLEGALPREGEAPFDSDRKRMATLHRIGDTAGLPKLLRQGLDEIVGTPHVVFAKGAADALLDVCNRRWDGHAVVELSNEQREKISGRNAALAGNGVRVLGMAFKPVEQPPQHASAETLEQELVFLGLVGMVDPVRPEARKAVEQCVAAGIRPVMITGDHPLMARYIARELGMLPKALRAEEEPAKGGVLTGRELQTMSEDDLREAVADVSVFARVAPEHKLRIVKALQDRGQICAMTGDGVNDAPALKSADIGVAMGITGTDVSKEASDMILQDDNFATIVAAVEEGRTIFSNIRRFIRFLLSCNSGEIWLFLIAPLLGMPLPLLPVQILWMNLVTDGLPALGLGVERAEPDVMQRMPRDPKSPIVGKRTGLHVLMVGLVLALVSLVMGYYEWAAEGKPAGGDVHGDGAEAAVWQTMIFTTMVFAQLFLALAERSDRYSLFTIGIFSNKPILWAVLAAIVLQLAVVYVPFVEVLFNTAPLPAPQLGLAVLVALIPFVFVELLKWNARRRERRS